jgi:integrase
MPIVRDSRSPFFYVDVRVGGQRFYQSTKIKQTRSEREALKFEVDFIRRKEQELAAHTPAGLAEMTFEQAGQRWFEERVATGWTNEHNKECALVYLAWLYRRIGKLKLRDISTAVILGLRDERAKETVRGEPIANATVNRSMEPVLRVLNRAKEVWNVTGLQKILKDEIKLREPNENPRWVREDEEAMLRTAFTDKPHYDRLVRFLRATGLRISEALIRWDAIDGNVIVSKGKGGKVRTLPISSEVRGILEACRVGNDTPFVFVTRYNGAVRPITVTAVSNTWQEARREGKLPADLRIHDLRHDFATQCVNDGVDIRTLQECMGHSKIQTTLKYAHVNPTRLTAVFEMRGAKLDGDRRAASLSVVA